MFIFLVYKNLSSVNTYNIMSIYKKIPRSPYLIGVLHNSFTFIVCYLGINSTSIRHSISALSSRLPISDIMELNKQFIVNDIRLENCTEYHQAYASEYDTVLVSVTMVYTSPFSNSKRHLTIHMKASHINVPTLVITPLQKF